ncbi:hypothetical protein AX17_003338 [Amanita inopinata Kibby_2008]|nr:hypothetical protein AX17_003338 [Amanita inopinata Kibby_2008]
MSLDVGHSLFLPPSPSQHGSPSSAKLTHAHIADALSRSPDHGVTLVFSKLDISEITAAAIQALASIAEDGKAGECHVERLALGHNRLPTLPPDFAHLTHLRYINLKHNTFTAFPHILTLMPSLEILDLSHNKIPRLPSQPGRLVDLKVLCLSRNKLTRLPPYMVQFRKLEVLHVDRNPIEWPPRPLINAGQSVEIGQPMKDWIQGLQKWLEMNSKSKYDHEPPFLELEREMPWDYSAGKTDRIDVVSHSRSGSIESTFSFASIPESVSDLAATKLPNVEIQRPPPLHLGVLRTYSDEYSPTKSFDSYAASPAESELFDGHSFPTVEVNESFESPIQHNRNASYAGQERQSQRTEVLAKMSMPDLRSAKLDITMKMPELPEKRRFMSRSNENVLQLPQRQDTSSSVSSDVRVFTPLDRSHADDPASHAIVSMTFERNSYFRRISTLPASTTLSKPLLCLIDTARSLLFAACQVYQTLDHYIVHAVDERLSSILRKVLDPASSDMLQLITALDQFDVISRKMLPPPAVCKAVVESCRDTAAAFSKVVGVLILQLQVLTTCDDIRYSRLLLVEVYTATAEIACAWKNMVPHIHFIKSMLHSKRLPGPISGSATNGQKKVINSSSDPSVLAFRHHLNGTGANNSSAGVTRTRTTRRHAGSFSSKDVEIGKQLPSYDDNPPVHGVSLSSGVSTPTPAVRKPKRQATTPATLPSLIPPSSAPVFRSLLRGTESSGLNHSRHGSQSSVQTSSMSSSPSIPNKTSLLELPLTSRYQVDKEALQAVREAVEIAPTVWDMMENVLKQVLSTNVDIRNSLNRARLITKRLTDMIRTLHENDNFNDRRLLREDARLFLKAVVQLSNALKTYKEAQDVSPALRMNMVKLTNATEEFAILLHVSSFSPSTPKSFSPTAINISAATLVAQPSEVAQLGSSLSRSRSAQATSNAKVNVMTYHEGPRSALPTQSFKVPTIQRTRGKTSASTGPMPGAGHG